MGDALLCKEEGTSESVMAVKAEGCGERKETPVFCPPALLVCCWTSASWCPWHPAAPFCELIPQAGDSRLCTFNLANVHIEARTKPIGFSLN